MTKRGDTRASTPVGPEATPQKPRKTTRANGNGRRTIGSRAFTRRARASQLVRTDRRIRRRQRSLALLAGRLPAFSPVGALRRIPRAAWICAVVACLNAICWSILTPPFQVPDEPSHFAYVKQLAETGSPPTSNVKITSVEEINALDALHYYNVRQQPHSTIASQFEQTELERGLATGPRDIGSAGSGVSESEPPLYYALETIPYDLGSSGTVLDRLQLMRLLSTLFAGMAGLFVFLFVREALPADRWAWTVGGLSVALAPLLGFMSGGVNPDSMLCAVAAALFYCLARGFRRGLTYQGAAAIGILTAIGFLTKLNFAGLAPGVLLGALVLSIRAGHPSRLRTVRLVALSIGIAVSPVLAYTALNALSGNAPLAFVTAAIGTTRDSLLAQINYIWQLYLPRLPGTVNDFPGLFTTRQLWFDHYVGLYGWLDTSFPHWVETLALVPAGLIALLCARALVQARVALRSRWPEMVVYAVMGIGLLVLLGVAGYRAFPEVETEYAQPRYLLPLFALVGAALALAARGAGRRWGPVVGVLIVFLFFAHDLFSQILEAGRFYI